MRKIGLKFLLFFPLTASGQSISYLENTVLYSNPAARIQEKFLSTTTLNIDYNFVNGKISNPRLQIFNYNKLAVKNFQFGIGTNSYIGKYFRSENHKLDANYTFHLTKKINLSVGFGANINKYGLYNSSNQDSISTISNRFVGLNAGLVLEGKKWRAGFSVYNMNEPNIRIFNDTMMLNYSLGFFAEYRFRINENWRITPLINFGANNQLRTVLGVSAYYKKLQFGTSLIGNGFSFFAGYTFNEKFMVSVISNFNRPVLNNGKLYRNTMLNFTFQVPNTKKEKGEKL
jgi:hypothetical protein